MSTPQPLAHVCAVIVTYHPDLGILRSAVAAIHGQVQRIVIVDNGSPEDTVSRLRHIAADVGAHLIPSPKNLGVAAGHNLGIAWARRQGCTHVLLLDQDSVAGPNMVAELLAAHHDLTARGVRVAAVGPRYEDPVSGHTSFFVRFGRLKFKRIHCTPRHCGERVEVDFLITSGSLISLAALDHIGGMDEDLFIDHVDTEWCLRARSKGYRAFGICDAVMHHTLGSETLRVWLWRWRFVPRHSPLRHYYVFRNSLLLYRRPYVPTAMILNDIVRLMFMLVFYSLRTAPRREHARMMIKGLIDGLRGRTGPFPSQSAVER